MVRVINLQSKHAISWPKPGQIFIQVAEDVIHDLMISSVEKQSYLKDTNLHAE